ncbi:Dynein axonemal heavy chain [Trichinella pseudospiralis]
MVSCYTFATAGLCLLISIASADRCVKHSDCLVENTVCLLRYCVPAQPIFSDENQCRTNWHCRCGVIDIFERSGRFCKNGYCFRLIDAFDSVGCRTHNDCPFNSLCISRHCVYAESTNKPCLRTGFCGIGERCIQGICYQPSSLIIHPSIETVYPESPVVIIVSPRGSISTDLTNIIEDKLAANSNKELPLIIPPHIIL